MADLTPAARPDLAALVAHYRDLLGLRDWAIDARWDDAGELPPHVLARVNPLPERKLATILVCPLCPPEELRATIAHEMVHALISPLAQVGEWSGGALMLEEQAVEALANAITRAEALPAEAAVMRRALRDLPSRLRARLSTPTAARSRDGASMEIPLIIAALKAALSSADVGGAVQALVDELVALYGDTAPAEAAAAPMDGESAPAMMRRAFTSIRTALARRAAPTDTLGPKVLARLGAQSDTEGLMRIETLLAAAERADTLTDADEQRQRKALAAETMKNAGLGRPAFFVDGSDELLPVWRAGTLDDMKRACAAIKAGGAPLARPRATPDANDEAGLAQRAQASGMTVEARRAAEKNVNRGRAAQET